jgi:hypothetical protein
MSPPQCAPDHLNSYWLKLSQFDDEFDSNQGFVPLINKGWLEKISTLSEVEVYSKVSIFETICNNKMRLPLQVQLYKPHHSWDRVFLVDDNWPDNMT